MEEAMEKRLSNAIGAALIAMMVGLGTATPAAAQSMPKVGDMAPEFSLKYFDGNDLKDVSLSQYRGKKNVVVAFYIFAFTPG